MSAHGRVLVVDDEPDMRTVLLDVFERAQFEVTAVGDGRSAMRELFRARFDVVVLDIEMPDLDGFDVLERIREVSQVPVLFLTARSREEDKVAGLLRGADDYLTKPFSTRELVARCHALLRRAPERDEPERVLDDGTVRIDFATRQVDVDDKQVRLTAGEWNLLVAFAQRPNRVLSLEQLLDIAYNDPLGIGPERVKFAVLRLRKRLGWSSDAASPIESVRGFGYCYRPRLR